MPDREKLKIRLERSLRTNIPQVVWKRLGGYGGALESYYDRSLEGGEEETNFRALRGIIEEELVYLEEYEREKEGLVRNAEPEFAAATPRATDLTGAEYLEPDLGEYEKQRRQALAEHAARLAGGEREVVDFRRAYLDGEVLKPEQAYVLLESAAACYLPESLFESSYIPLQHQAELVGYERRADKPKIDHRVTVKVDPPGVLCTVQYAPRDPCSKEDPVDPAVDYRVCVTEDEEDHRRVKAPNSWRLKYVGRHGLKKTSFVWPMSLLDILRRQSDLLAKRYDWRGEDAVWFFLTGEPPKLSTLKLGVRLNMWGHKATINLEVAPWVSADMVKENYRKVQRQVLGKRSHELPLRSLAVFRFVERKTREAGELPSWPKLLTSWNAENPEWEYSNFRGLYQTYHRTYDKLLSPLQLPKSKPLPPEAKVELKAREERLIQFLRATVNIE